MNTSDWVLVATSLFLGAIALITPWLSEIVKRKAFAPKLAIEFELEPPYCHKTYFRSSVNPNLQAPVYYFRFQVSNTGQTQARLCEAVLEKIWVYDSSGRPTEIEGYSPVNLRWSSKGSSDPTYSNITPRRKVFCDIGHLASPEHQQRENQSFLIDTSDGHGPQTLRFILDQTQYPFSQPNCFVPGRYGMKIVLYSENAATQVIHFQLTWSGKWQDKETNMFRELVIRKANPI